jgi:cytochrome c biogenesis protein
VRTGDGWVAAEKGYVRETGNLLFHVCLLVLLGAVAVGSLLGWRATVIVVEGRGFSNALTQYDTFTSGALVDPGGLAPFSLVLDDFAARYQVGGQQSGAPRDYSADVSVRSEPGAAAVDARIAVNSPLKVGGANVYLQGHGYAPRIVVRDAQDKVVYDDSAVFLPRDGVFTSTGVVKVPDASPQLGFQGVLLPTLGVGPDGGPVSLFPAAEDPVVFLTAWQGDLGLDAGVPQSIFRLDTADMTQVGQSALRLGETWTLPDGLGSVEFAGLPEYASFSVARDPGKGLALAAAVLAIAGLTLSLFIPRRRAWVRAQASESGRTLVTVAALSRAEGAAVDEVTATLLDEVVPPPEVRE